MEYHSVIKGTSYWYMEQLGVCSKPQKLPGWNLELVSIHREQRETEERSSQSKWWVVISISKGIYKRGLPWAATRWLNLCTPPRILTAASCCCSVAKSCLTFNDSIDGSTWGFPVLHHLLELAQTHVHRVSDAIQPSHPLLPPSPPASNLSHHQGLFQWVSSSRQVSKVLELQLQHQSFWWTFRVVQRP